jgi:hypothetical protein
MTNSTEKIIKQKQVNKPNGGRGGARKGSGRPKTAQDTITIKGLLEMVHKKADGKNYEEILIEDFMKARDDNDRNLVVKYHNLILNKVMNSLAKVEVTDSADNIEMKQQAFAEALAKLTGVQK